MFEAPIQQQPLFQTPASDDYYTGGKPPMEFPLSDLLGGSADEIGGTQLSGAPARDPADVGAATRNDGGLPRLVTACGTGIGRDSVGGGGGAGGLVRRGDSTGTDRSGGRRVGLGDSTCSHRRGAAHRARRLHRQPPEGGLTRRAHVLP
jgi:hypothetical protein